MRGGVGGNLGRGKLTVMRPLPSMRHQLEHRLLTIVCETRRS